MKRIAFLFSIAALATAGACRPESHRHDTGKRLEWQSLSAGNAFTCGVAVSGKAYCWGDGTKGALGTDWILEACFNGIEGYFPCSTRPIPIDARKLERVSSATTVGTACGLDGDGNAACWGTNESGALGIGAAPANAFAYPHRVRGGLELTDLAAGGMHVCGVDEDGAAWCWGYNGTGQVGIGTSSEISSCLNQQADAASACEAEPVPVSGGLVFGRITAGTRHTCALDGENAAWCWGAGLFPSDTATCQGYPCSLEPREVAGAPPFDALFSGGNTACGLASNGRAFCWGDRPGSAGADDGIPREVSGGHRWTSITAAAEVVCGVATDGRGWCWGTSSFLGRGPSESNTDVPLEIGDDHRWQSLTAGPTHVCGIASDGAAWCWGDNLSGELGIGEQSGPRFYPAAVGGPFTHAY